MTEATRDLLKRALELPPAERAHLAQELVDSLEDADALEEPGELSPEWRAELARRFAEEPKPGEASPDEVIAEGLA